MRLSFSKGSSSGLIAVSQQLTQRQYIFSTILIGRRFASNSRSISSRTLDYLQRLEADANSRPQDAYSQLRLLSELNKHNPRLVVQRFESGYFNSQNEAIVKEYLKALVSTNQIENANLNNIIPIPAMATATPLIAGNSAGNAYNNSGILGSIFAKDSDVAPNLAAKPNDKPPIKVQLMDGGFRSQLWKTTRFFLMGYLVLSFIATMIGDLNVGKQLGMSNQEVKPSRDSTKTFKDVKGASEAKEELQEIVAYLKNPQKFTRLGGKLPKGVLLTGPPGTGKTLLAKAIAGEASVPFFYASGSEFEEMYVGVGARRIRDLFAAAKANAPCIVFIDEIDAIGSTRALKEQQAMKMTLNQLLVELDGFKESQGVIIIGATNFPEILDPALIRPGRFDRSVVVPLPDLRERSEILELYLNKVPHSRDVNIVTLARGCPGFSGADLANMVNVAALRASTEDKDLVNMVDLERAKDRILMGSERKAAVIPETVRRLTAWHEGGHALVAFYTEGALPLHKATLIPRGPALGMVVQLPEEQDLLQRTKKQMLAEIDVCLAGRAAEELVFGENNITSGASSDLEKATAIARRMVNKFGMSSKVGMVFFNKDDKSRESEMEVKRILDESYSRVRKLIKYKRKELDRLANGLLEYESLTRAEIQAVMQGQKLKKLTILEEITNNESEPKAQPNSITPDAEPKTLPGLIGVPVPIAKDKAKVVYKETS